MSNKIEIYKLYKDEVKREDEITFQKSMSSLTFQGFLFASATFLISNPWFKETAVPIFGFRKFVLILQGLTGFVVGALTAMGVMAAASSIRAVAAAYQRVEDKDPEWPQLHGQERQARLGGGFAIWLHLCLSGLWAAYEGGLIAFTSSSDTLAVIVAGAMLLILSAFYFAVKTYLRAGEGLSGETSKSDVVSS